MFPEHYGYELVAEDIRVGKLVPNGWLISAVACLTEYPNALHVLFGERDAASNFDNKVLFLFCPQ